MENLCLTLTVPSSRRLGPVEIWRIFKSDPSHGIWKLSSFNDLQIYTNFSYLCILYTNIDVKSSSIQKCSRGIVKDMAASPVLPDMPKGTQVCKWSLRNAEIASPAKFMVNGFHGKCFQWVLKIHVWCTMDSMEWTNVLCLLQKLSMKRKEKSTGKLCGKVSLVHIWSFANCHV